MCRETCPDTERVSWSCVFAESASDSIESASDSIKAGARAARPSASSLRHGPLRTGLPQAAALPDVTVWGAWRLYVDAEFGPVCYGN